ncbi:MAG: SRPBCC domain-containing protein [Streptosporangiaceae bacterium]
MTPSRHGSARIEFPNELEVLITREFDAPIALVFDVLTKPEYVSKWGAYPSDPMTECSIDLRVGGNYHFSFVTEDGTVCSFRGTYLEVEPPVRTMETWLFGGWPDAEAVETWQLHETGGVTTVTMRLAFRDKAGAALVYQHASRDRDEAIAAALGDSLTAATQQTERPLSGTQCARRDHRENEDQRALDKEPLREWMVERGFRGDGHAPVMTDEVRIATATRYILLAEEMTQRSFEAPEVTAAERVANVLRD